ncbi:MAG TPA: winged helix-turn-helix transcriptional regulator [Candidatus Baltobacteraceae bacterium]|nr:winged helix-turn-helix transcriptional regulator [Candidatus Baltobacteraceae bacterium]
MEYYSFREKEIIKELSKNSRATITDLARVARCSRITAKRALEALEERMGVRYTLEINEESMGATERHILTVKFTRKPDRKFLERLFAKEDAVHAAYLAEGSYDLIIYARTSDPISYIKWETHLATELSDYGAVIKPSEFIIAQFGYMPLTDSFVDSINPRIKLTASDKKLLKLLNANSRMSYEELSQKTGLNDETVRYRIFRLKKSGIIKRFTIAAQRPINEYVLSFFVNYRFNRTTKERSSMARSNYAKPDGATYLLTSYQMLAPITGSYRFFLMGLYGSEREAIEKAIKPHMEIFRKENVEMSRARITGAIKGILPFRNLSVAENYLTINWE